MYVVNQFKSKMSPYQVDLVDDMMNDLSDTSRVYLKNILSRSYVIGVQHLMETELCLFDGLLCAGAIPEQIRFAGKLYSDYFPAIQTLRGKGINIHTINHTIKPGEFSIAIKQTIRDMWQYALADIEDANNIDNIIILDEGGRALEEIPRYLKNKYSVIVIEHTRGGLYNSASQHMNIPILKPALSAVKKILESPKIVSKVVKTVLQKISKLPYSQYKVYGVVGLGNIGAALSRELVNNGYEVIAFDTESEKCKSLKDKSSVELASTLDELIHNSEVIIGTTGKDISVDFNFKEHLCHDIFLISASSEDKEFKSLLKSVDSNKPLQNDIKLKTDNGNTITILSGGFPVNFDQASESVPIKDICITRALMLGSIFQACFLLRYLNLDDVTSNLSLATDASLQYYLAQKYLTYDHGDDFNNEVRQIFSSLDCIKSFSEGMSLDCDEFKLLLTLKNDFSTSTEKSRTG